METFYYLEKALRSMSADEHKHFERFITSPYLMNHHAHNRTIHKLYKRIKSFQATSGTYHDFNWTREIEKITSGATNENYISKVKSEFLEYMLEFFAYESFRKVKFHLKFSVLKELHNKGLVELFDHHCKANYLYPLIENCPEEDRLYHYYKLCHVANEHKNKTDPDNCEHFIEYDLLLRLYKKESERLLSKIPLPLPEIADAEMILLEKT